MSHKDMYSPYFSVGMRVGVGIPMGNAEVFRDWAYIEAIEEDLISMQLSRDYLPESVRLTSGQILELRGGKDENGYSCRAIIVSEGYAKVLLLRLVGEVVSDELREFYRIDAFLPIKYFLCNEQKPHVLEKIWDNRRQERIESDLVRKQRRWNSSHIPGVGELPNEKHQNHEEDDDDSWDTIIPIAANISGGGMRLQTHQDFEEKEYVLLEILVPSPRRIVDAVARVVFAREQISGGKPTGYFNTAFQFVFIDEGDRDAIVSHISNVQLKRIRQLRESYLFRDKGDEQNDPLDAAKKQKEKIRKRIFFTIVLCVVTFIVVSYFRGYSQNRPKNEIELIFEGGIKRYLEKHQK